MALVCASLRRSVVCGSRGSVRGFRGFSGFLSENCPLGAGRCRPLGSSQ
jgi:hypothetical protein